MTWHEKAPGAPARTWSAVRRKRRRGTAAGVAGVASPDQRDLRGVDELFRRAPPLRRYWVVGAATPVAGPMRFARGRTSRHWAPPHGGA